MPRSGTKLLRDLLNRHPRIAIPTVESHFLPSFVKTFGPEPDLAADAPFEELWRALARTNFIRVMESRGVFVPRARLRAAAARGSWTAIFGQVMRSCTTSEIDSEFIWGDKTPRYLNDIRLLSQLLPAARFVHIVRDPRDVCVSVRSAWRKSIHRAAARWSRDVERAHGIGVGLEDRYMEIHYEQLLEEPIPALTSVCDFLEVEFVDSMTTLERSYETSGDASGHTDIVRGNREKFFDRFRPAETRRVEEIAYTTMLALGYRPEYARGPVPLGRVAEAVLRIHDGAAMLRYYVSVLGLSPGVARMRQYRREDHIR